VNITSKHFVRSLQVSKENCVRSKQGDTVAFFQLAKVARTGHVFESNFGKEVFIRKLGVTALDQALLNMCAGERRAILVMPQAVRFSRLLAFVIVDTHQLIWLTFAADPPHDGRLCRRAQRRRNLIRTRA
jgi:hypothetical protein